MSGTTLVFSKGGGEVQVEKNEGWANHDQLQYAQWVTGLLITSARMCLNRAPVASGRCSTLWHDGLLLQTGLSSP